MALAHRRPDKQWLELVIETVGLGDRLLHRPSELSGGQQQRVAVARALAGKPEIIFADEPTGNLDSRSGAEILSFMRRAVRELGQTIVMVTHDPVAASYADRVVFLADGRVVDEIPAPTPESVLDRLKQIAGPEQRSELIPSGRQPDMFTLTVKGLWAHKLRYALTGLAVVLGVAFMAGTMVLTDTMERTFDGVFASANDGTDVIVRRDAAIDGELATARDRVDAERRRPGGRPSTASTPLGARSRASPSSSTPTARCRRPTASASPSAPTGSRTSGSTRSSLATGRAPAAAERGGDRREHRRGPGLGARRPDPSADPGRPRRSRRRRHRHLRRHRRRARLVARRHRRRHRPAAVRRARPLRQRARGGRRGRDRRAT